ncbi:MAG: hypothetical protein HY308_16170 [Gammaproteobacteria bacterium]|nr:hypothetical protein [Gammaproteobacteria bacterium]
MQSMKRWLIIPLLAMPWLCAHAEYTVAPDIAQEYRQLKAKAGQAPNDTELNFEYATCLSYLGKVEEGRTVLKHVRQLDPGFANKVLPKYLKKQQENPNDLKAKYRLGFLYYFKEDYAQALNLLGQVANSEPVGQLNAWALGYMGVVKGKLGKWDEAENLVQRALKIEPEAYGLHAALAVAQKKKGETFAAMRSYMTALEERNKFERYEKQHLQ